MEDTTWNNFSVRQQEFIYFRLENTDNIAQHM